MIMSYLGRSSRVSRKKLDRLSAAGRRMYEGLYEGMLRAQQSARPAPPQQAATPRVSFTVSQPVQSDDIPHMPSVTRQGQSTPTSRRTPGPATPGVARSLAASLQQAASYGDSDAELDDPLDEEEEKDPVQIRGNPGARLDALLQRQGVPAGRLCALDAVQAARVEVGGGSFEQWWLARSSHIKHASVASYYEGLLLSLLLDQSDDPAVWKELAARRWLTINLVANHSFQWGQARSLLPLSGVSCMSTDLVYEMQRYVKSQQDLFPTANRSAFSGRGKGDSKPAGGAKGGQKGRGGSGGGSTDTTGAATAAGSGGGATQRRNSTGGAGASNTAGARQG